MVASILNQRQKPTMSGGRRTCGTVASGVLRFPTDVVFRELAGLLNAIAIALGVEGPSP
jgi:hypothetical protein